MENNENKTESIENLRLSYDAQLESSDANTRTSIDAYHKWYNAAVSYFSQDYYDDDSFQRFNNVDNGGNGYCLRDNYHKILGVYHVLLNKDCNKKTAKNIKKFMNTKYLLCMDMIM
jgi:hypothetical protein